MNPDSLPSASTPQTLSIRLFGPPQLLLDGQPIHFESRKAIALIAYLACHEEPRPRAELATLLWPESDRTHALGALRYTLSIIRKKLGNNWLEIDRRSIALQSTPQLHVDLSAFAHHWRLGIDPARGVARSIPDLEQAVSLYTESFLANFALRDSINFDDWLLFESEKLEAKLADALERLCRHHAEEHNFDRAIHHAKRWLQLDPLQENVQRHLISLYHQAGQIESALRQYQNCVDLLRTELNVAPAAETSALAEQIQSRQAAAQLATILPTIDPRPNNLHAPTTPFIGREEELTSLSDLLRDDACRLISLIGPGGIGKTRLAETLARRALADDQMPFAHGIFFVPLASVDSVTGILTALADTLGFTFAGTGDPLELLSAYLASRQTLFVLDNFEQLVPHADLLTTLLQQSSGIKLVVTSRERLNLYEEWFFPLDGLPVEQIDRAEISSGEREPTSTALQLFQQRARRANPRFVLANERVDALSICQLVQGLPLGIELAAGWVGDYACVEITREIRKNLDFLATSLRNVPDRHRSLRAVFLHSWDLLTVDQQAAFRNISVFRGGFMPQAAEAIAFASPIALQRLVDKSLLVGKPWSDGSMSNAGAKRYDIHDLLRQYAGEQLNSVDEEAVHWRHCLYFAGYAYARRDFIRKAGERQAATEMDTEYDNIRTAWQWALHCLETGNRTVDAVVAIAQFVPMLSCLYTRYSRLQEGKEVFGAAVHLFENVLQNASKQEDASTHKLIQFVLAQLRTQLADLLLPIADFAEAQMQLEKAIETFRTQNAVPELAAAPELAEALSLLSRTLISLNEYEQAEKVGRESLALYQQHGDRSGSTQALYAIGVLYLIQGHYEEGIQTYQQALTIYREDGYRRGIGRVLSNLGTAYARMAFGSTKSANLTRSLRNYQESLEISIEENEPEMICVSHSNIGSTNRQLGDVDAARNHYTQSLALSQKYSMKRWTAVNLYGLGMTLYDSGDLPAAAHYLEEGLAQARRVQTIPDVLDNLAGLGCILAQQSGQDNSRKIAATVLHFVQAHPRSKEIALRDSGELLIQLQSDMPSPIFAEATAQAERLTIPDAVALVDAVAMRKALEA